ncbi:MAG TPA: class I SAM-dependent methyltransferase [Clostridia bacterium]|nr:class I SAM-dependent methyltransferase [Clostridia bacterium]
MTISKEWEWSKEKNPTWLNPSEDSYYLANRWKTAGFHKLLDFGCGLGRHSIFFAKNGFDVYAFDLSTDGVKHLQRWAEIEKLEIHTEIADMLELPYPDNSFDCVLAYHVISHTDSRGIEKIIKELKRVLKKDGEFYLTLCSKETWSYKDAGYPRVDENTIVKTDDGPEKGVPHFYVTLEDILTLFKDFSIIRVRHVDDCYYEGNRRNSKHYYILGKS